MFTKNVKLFLCFVLTNIYQQITMLIEEYNRNLIQQFKYEENTTPFIYIMCHFCL
jgi:hypothetical protein